MRHRGDDEPDAGRDRDREGRLQHARLAICIDEPAHERCYQGIADGSDAEDGPRSRIGAVLDLDKQEGGEAGHAHLRAGEETPPEEGGRPRKGEDLAIARKHGTDSYGLPRGTPRSVRVTPTARCDGRIAWGQIALRSGRSERRSILARGTSTVRPGVFVVGVHRSRKARGWGGSDEEVCSWCHGHWTCLGDHCV